MVAINWWHLYRFVVVTKDWMIRKAEKDEMSLYGSSFCMNVSLEAGLREARDLVRRE